MLAIFEEFLAKPSMLPLGDDELERFINGCLQKLPECKGEHVRWHVAVFLSEFVIDGKTAGRCFDSIKTQDRRHIGSFNTEFFGSVDFLNWSGKELYQKLKGRTDDPE